MAAGVRKIRLTGGEPLVRRNIMQLINNLGAEVKAGVLDELTITTNGAAEKMAGDLEAGVRRVNISLDTSIRKNSTASRDGAILTRCLPNSRGAVGRPWCENRAALKGEYDGDLADMLAWCGSEGFDMTIIEVCRWAIWI